MLIKKSEYVISATKKSNFPKLDYPQFAFLGRSNVGKSSFINALTNRKKLAYSSSKPGKTITLNFYTCNDSITFVDVPGYGFASNKGYGSATHIQAIQEMGPTPIHRETFIKNFV